MKSKSSTPPSPKKHINTRRFFMRIAKKYAENNINVEPCSQKKVLLVKKNWKNL